MHIFLAENGVGSGPLDSGYCNGLPQEMEVIVESREFNSIIQYLLQSNYKIFMSSVNSQETEGAKSGRRGYALDC